MANQDRRGNNRYTNTLTSEETVNQVDNNEVVLNILKDEFPDDPFFVNGKLGAESPARQALDSFKTKSQKRKNKKLVPAERNDKNVLAISTEEDEYADYELSKTFPTIDEDDLDDLIDEEWEFFEDPEDEDEEVPIIEPGVTGLFLVNQEKDLEDFHHLYIQGGPQNLDEETEEVATAVFCVFYIQNGIAYPIPTYKTLEVMLVERGLSHDSIREATSEEIKDFDLLIDGAISDEVDYDDVDFDEDEDDDITPYDEFVARSLPVRDSEWNYTIRVRSGYMPKLPFLRDPGDYIKPESSRRFDGRAPVDEDGNELGPDRYVEEDPDDLYYDRVFQKQTFKEKLREKYEGKMIVADWPQPTYDATLVENAPGTATDDAVRNLRIMVNGHWKFVNDGRVMKLYAYLYDYDISNYGPPQAGRYGPTGYIQMLIDSGGIKVVQPNDGVDGVNDTLSGDSDMSIGNKAEPLWNAFPHIVEADTDGISGVDFAEYQEYLDNFNNGGAPFNIPELQPYEPPGSIAYYNKQEYADLVEQAIAQAEIDVIKEQIFELWPQVSTQISSTKIALDALPADFSDHVDRLLGKKGPLYKIMLSRKGQWKFVKKIAKWRGGKIKTKERSRNLFKVCSKSLRIKTNLNEKQERDLVKKYKWMKTVKRDKFAGWLNSGGRTAVGVGSGVAAIGSVALGISTVGRSSVIAFRLAGYGSRLAGVCGGGLFPGGWLVMNPILAYGSAALAAFAIIDKLAGEVPADKYDLPPWRFMDDKWYLKACIYNEIDDRVAELTSASEILDAIIPALQEDVNEVYGDMGELENRILNAQDVNEFQDIFDTMMALRSAFEELDSDGLLTYALQTKKDVDSFVRDQLKRQYNAVQYLRKKVYNKIGKKKKFGIVWPKGPQAVLNQWVPGCKFDNFVRKKK
jgi:hypothetical protein